MLFNKDVIIIKDVIIDHRLTDINRYQLTNFMDWYRLIDWFANHRFPSIGYPGSYCTIKSWKFISLSAIWYFQVNISFKPCSLHVCLKYLVHETHHLRARAFAPARKKYWIGLLFTRTNTNSGAISLTERGCTASISKVESPISDKSVHTVSESFLFCHEKLSATTTTTTTGSREYVKKAIALDLIQNWYQLQNNNFASASRFFVLSLLSLHDVDVKLPSFTFVVEAIIFLNSDKVL